MAKRLLALISSVLFIAMSATWAQEVPPLLPSRPATPASQAPVAPPIGAKSSYKQAEQLPAAAAAAQVYPIDLPTALRLAEGQNPQIQFARERITAAEAELARADVLLLPSLVAGGEWLRHDGQIQDIGGTVFQVSKSSLFAGGGVHGIVSVADAYFEPLAARQVVANRVAGARTTANDTLRDVAVGYYELVRAKALLATAQETLDNAGKLDKLAQSYFGAQKLRAADAERVRTEFRGRGQELETAQQNVQVASIRLAQRLRLDPFVLLEPADAKAAPITLVDPNAAANELAVTALMNRPELQESQSLVNVAIERLRRARFGPLLPSVLLDYRAGVFGGGPHEFVGNTGGRGDADAAIVWELHNFGFGDRALARQRESELRQAQIQVVGVMDAVVADVADALARLRSLQLQMVKAKQAVASAEQSYQLNFNLFVSGGKDSISPLEVLQSIQALAKARVDYLNAIIDYDRAQFQLYWALGNPVEQAEPKK